MGLPVFGNNAGTLIVIVYITLDLAATYKCGTLTNPPKVSPKYLWGF